eukprot:11962717-Heterocapsa_arctica.AAC.1
METGWRSSRSRSGASTTSSSSSSTRSTSWTTAWTSRGRTALWAGPCPRSSAGRISRRSTQCI